MNTAEWILVAFLSVALFVFIVVGIILLVKLIQITKEAKKVVIKSQDIASNTNDVINNIKGVTSIGGIIKTITDKYVESKKDKEEKEEEESDDGEM